jgi:pilus assembly protein Flp/PilA
MSSILVALLRDDRGATAIEYGFTAALIALVLVSVFRVVGTNLSTVFNTIATDL